MKLYWLNGWILLVRHLGVRGALRYEQDRRAGAMLNYDEIFTPEELAQLSEHIQPCPWERGYPGWKQVK